MKIAPIRNPARTTPSYRPSFRATAEWEGGRASVAEGACLSRSYLGQCGRSLRHHAAGWCQLSFTHTKEVDTHFAMSYASASFGSQSGGHRKTGI